ncbi:MAG: hypothetical protein Q4C96_00255 [Planctomycetia bacterium]|nr:hypothetical protein [Planctomycetia bacterium]
MLIRDRIKEFRRVEARSLMPNPKNWRTHPDSQKNALKGILAEIGFADALIARELPNGELVLIDGHLRAETTPDQILPVLVLDVTEEEADKLLALLDPLASMAGKNSDILSELIQNLETSNQAVKDLLDTTLASKIDWEVIRDSSLHDTYSSDKNSTDAEWSDDENSEKICPSENNHPREIVIPEIFQVVVECKDENHQREIYEKLSQEGLPCRLLNL